MSRTIELPDAIYVALDQAARASGTTPADWIAAHLSPANGADSATVSPDKDWLDRDYLKTYAQEGDESVSLESVRQAMAKIPGRLVDDIRAERDES
jgi:hypothetical protein